MIPSATYVAYWLVSVFVSGKKGTKIVWWAKRAHPQDLDLDSPSDWGFPVAAVRKVYVDGCTIISDKDAV